MAEERQTGGQDGKTWRKGFFFGSLLLLRVRTVMLERFVLRTRETALQAYPSPQFSAPRRASLLKNTSDAQDGRASNKVERSQSPIYSPTGTLVFVAGGACRPW